MVEYSVVLLYPYICANKLEILDELGRFKENTIYQM